MLRLQMYNEKKVFKLWWSTIPPISTKRTITSHLNSLNTEKTMAYDVGNHGHGLGQTQKCGTVKLIVLIFTRKLK